MLYYSKQISGVQHTRTSDLTAEQLADLWSISLDSAKRTLSATDQESLNILEGKITRRIKTKAHQRRYDKWVDTLACFVPIHLNPMSLPYEETNIFNYFVIVATSMPYIL